MSYAPYSPNAKSLVEALIDFKSIIASNPVPSGIALRYATFENISQGDAVYLRASDAKVGRAIANSSFDEADVLGIAQTSQTAGNIVQILIAGIAPALGLTPGTIYYLSATTPGGLTATAPSTAGHYVTRLGEATGNSQLAIQLEQPIKIA